MFIYFSNMFKKTYFSSSVFHSQESFGQIIDDVAGNETFLS